MTLLEGWAWRLGNWVCWLFLAYLLLFTRVVGAALMTACPVAFGSVSRGRGMRDMTTHPAAP